LITINIESKSTATFKTAKFVPGTYKVIYDARGAPTDACLKSLVTTYDPVAGWSNNAPVIILDASSYGVAVDIAFNAETSIAYVATNEAAGPIGQAGVYSINAATDTIIALVLGSLGAAPVQLDTVLVSPGAVRLAVARTTTTSTVGIYSTDAQGASISLSETVTLPQPVNAIAFRSAGGNTPILAVRHDVDVANNVSFWRVGSGMLTGTGDIASVGGTLGDKVMVFSSDGQYLAIADTGIFDMDDYSQVAGTLPFTSPVIWK
jgi:hypothetical protein